MKCFISNGFLVDFKDLPSVQFPIIAASCHCSSKCLDILKSPIPKT